MLISLQSPFFKSIASNLRTLSKVDQEQRKALYGPDAVETDLSEEDDDEYYYRGNRPTKKRRIGN